MEPPFQAAPPLFPSGIAPLALLQEGWCGLEDSCFANYTSSPVLLAPRQEENLILDGVKERALKLPVGFETGVLRMGRGELGCD